MGTRGPESWARWYAPFFQDLIGKWPVIRGFSYINRLNTGSAARYGDCRIEASKYGLGDKYKAVLVDGPGDGRAFVHGAHSLAATCAKLAVPGNCSSPLGV